MDSKFIFLLSKRQSFNIIQKVKGNKRKTGHKTCKKPTTIASSLPTTHFLEYRFKQNCH